MKTRVTSEMVFALLAVAIFAGRAVAAPPAAAVESLKQVVITLHAPGRIAAPILCVADIADLRGGDEALRQQIAELDLEETPRPGVQTEITPRQIEFRLRVAGIDPRLISIRGSTANLTTPRASAGSGSAARRVVEPRASVLFASHSEPRSGAEAAASVLEIERAVLDAARKCLSKQLPWPEENVVIQLAQTLPRKLLEQMLPAGTTCIAEMQTTVTPLGRVALRVTVTAPGQRTLEVPVLLDVRHFDNVVATARPIDRGHVFSQTDLEFVRQDVTLLSGYCTSPDQFVGQKAKRVLSASHVVRAVDVEPEVRTPGPVLVKRRDRVKASARSGMLLVTVVGEAQQDGRAGEVIKVKNVDSNAFIYGRVLSATEVEVTE